MNKKETEALRYHSLPKPGKIAVVPTKKYATQHDLSLAYSPGVATPCLEIARDKNNVYKYTSKGNLVAVISNGTAVLGLGDIGAEASKPVMEGKGLLFKIFADIDVFDIELDTTDVDKFIETVKTIAPTFGGINLEDIKAPEAFEIETRLKEELNIPVMHDDQHGTAIISSAALINALEIVNKDISQVQFVVNGAGAAAVSCTRLYISLGANPDNIVMCDSKGVIRKDRTDLNEQKTAFATNKDLHTLEEAMQGSDVFIGLSKGDVVTPEMLLSMNENPIVFAMANPTPEISYDLAIKTREDIIMATGRSDHPNQVNNVLGFPFIFRGALDVRATKINEEMKLAAVRSLAELTKKTVPEEVNIVYDKVSLSFGKDYIIPKPFDPRLIYEIPPAVARAAMDSGVAQKPITNWEAYQSELIDRSGNGKKEIRMLQNRAKLNPKKIVFAEADHLDVLKTAQRIYEEHIGHPILLGRKEIILELKEELGFTADLPIIDPKTDEQEEQRNHFAELYWKRRQRKGVSLIQAQRFMRERTYFATMMVNTGQADTMVTGYTRSYSSVVKPILELVDKQKSVSSIASTSIILTNAGPIFLADTTVNVSPSKEKLAEIALLTANSAKMFGLKPSIAMLSYSSFGSVDLEGPKRVQEAVEYLHKEYPDLVVDGEIRADFALNPELIKSTFPFSKLNTGKIPNVMIFPSLDAANITYNFLKEVDSLESIGPILLGLDKPIQIIPLGSSVDEMVNIATIAILDAQAKEKK